MKFKMWYKIVLYIIHLQIELATLNKYCNLCSSHTMCKYKEGPANTCIKYQSTHINIETQGLIVNLHNKLRNNVALGLESRGNPGPQPPAANMLTLKWDEELAIIAQRWADTCISAKAEKQNDDCRRTDRFEVGQNVISVVDNNLSVPNFVSMILYWYNSVVHVNAEDISFFESSDYKNYTQIVWASTRFVGCGHSSFVEEIDGNMKRVHRFVCNYAPKGNNLGSSVYMQGIPCSQCGDSEIFVCDNNYPGLCAEKMVTDNELQLSEILQVVKSLLRDNGMSASLDDAKRSNQKVPDSLQLANRTNTKRRQGDLNYSEILLSYLTKALDYRKQQEMFDTQTDGHRKYPKDNQVFVNMKELDHNRTVNESFISELRNSVDPSDLPMGYIVMEADYKKVNGIWTDGLCRCNYIFRSQASLLNPNITLWSLLALLALLSHMFGIICT